MPLNKKPNQTLDRAHKNLLRNIYTKNVNMNV